MKLPKGFRFAAVAAGIRPSKPDVALFVSDCDAACAGAFTINRAKAAAVVDAERRLPSDAMRAVLVTSGNANALTGRAGIEAVDAMHGAAARALGVERSQVVGAATGVIGMRMPFEKVVAMMPRCVEQLGPDPSPAAEAIMTTDTTKKLASRSVVLDGTTVTLTGICKGSGMIAPQLATMIAVIATDCAVDAATLSWALGEVAPGTRRRAGSPRDRSPDGATWIATAPSSRHSPRRSPRSVSSSRATSRRTARARRAYSRSR